MPSVESEGQAARQQLERVLSSSGFARNERLSGFLRFAVERHLEGRDEELKESVIAIEVFGRPPGHDSKKDPIVRTEAGRLRSRLAEYYLGEGKDDPLIIELPKGGYVPLLRASATKSADVPSRPRYPWAVAATIAVLMVALAILTWWRFHQAAPIGIAVLPLENLSHNPADDYLADGLTDELIRNLTLLEGLSHRSRTSSFAFKGQPRNVREMGRELGADYILEGSVLRAGPQLRIDAQLIRVRDDFPIWSGKFDREATDIFAMQDEISRGIVNSLRLKLGRGQRHYETSVEAYDLYLRARALGTQGSGDESIGLFEQAIAKENSFAPGYAGIASTYAYFSGTFGNLQRRDDQLQKMRAAAERAIQLDPLLAEAHDARAVAYARDGKWVEAERGFQEAILIDTNRSMTHADFAIELLLVVGRTGEALRQLLAAERLDPLSPELQYFVAYGLTLAQRYDEAASHCEKLPAEFRNKPECLGRARLGQGRVEEALQVLAPLRNRGNRGYLGYAYARAGRRDEAEKLAIEIAPNPFNEALVFAGLNDKARTLEALERMAMLGPLRVGRALAFPEFAFVRGDPRVKTLRKSVGLPD